MLAALILALAAAVAEPPAKEPAAKLELFAKEDFYKNQPGKEVDFVGVLEKVKGPEVGFGRYNPYRLVIGEGAKKTTREVYVGGKTDILDAYTGKKIKLTGKAVDMEVEGTIHKEIWPARLELIKEDKKEGKKDQTKKDEPPAKADILVSHKLYKMEPGQEKEFVGMLMKRDRGGYYLSMKQGDKTTTEDLILYDDAGDPLAPYVGKKVKLHGKQVAGAVGMRTFRHTLPGRLEVLPLTAEEKQQQEDRDRNEAELQGIIERLRETNRELIAMNDILRAPRGRPSALFGSNSDDKPMEPKIAAKSFWLSNSAKPQTLLIRTPEEAAVAMGVPANKAKDEDAQREATAQLAKQFKVAKIDWQKQMVVVAAAGERNTGGYSVEITGLEIKDKTLIVKWKVNAPKPGSVVTQVITYPATAALVDRFDGEVKFDPPAPKSNDKDK